MTRALDILASIRKRPATFHDEKPAEKASPEPASESAPEASETPEECRAREWAAYVEEQARCGVIVETRPRQSALVDVSEAPVGHFHTRGSRGIG